MTTRPSAERLRRLVYETGQVLQEIPEGDLDLDRRRAAIMALRELWTVALEAVDPAYFARMAVHLADEHALGEPAALYQQCTQVELLDLHTAAT
jgi:hypothetical protein